MPDSAHKELYFGLFVAVIAFLVYANSLGNGFTGDDHSIILNNPVLQESPLSLFSRIDTTDENQLLPYYRPLTYLTYQLEWRLHNFNPFLVRLVNVLLHSITAFLVYRLARTLITCRYSALLVALLFAVHPLQSEAVDYNSARNTVLSCLFCLAAYLSHRRSLTSVGISLPLSGALLFLAALFFKETSLAILPFIMALETIPLRSNTRGSRIRAALRLTPYAAGALFYLLLRWQTLSGFGIQNTFLPGVNPSKLIQSMYVTPDLGARLMQNIYIIPRYLATLFNPTALSTLYVVPVDLTPYWPQLAVAWLFIITVLIWLLTKARTSTTLFGLSWAIIFWIPTSGIIYFPSAPLADRFLYIPAIGLWLIIADQTQRFLQVNNSAKKYVACAFVLILLALAGLTIRRNLDWKNDLTLDTRMVEQYPDNAHAHAFLGGAYIGSNNIDLAEKEFTKALELDASLTSIYLPLGYIYMRKEDYVKALFYYEKVLAASPKDRDARINSALALEKLGRFQEALEAYKQYLTMPGYNNVPGSQEYAEQRVRELSKQ